MVCFNHISLSVRSILKIHPGAAQVAKTFRKYGKAVPANILAAAENNEAVTTLDDTGSDPAVPSDQYDSSYLSPVTVGSNTLHLDFDTGSADL